MGAFLRTSGYATARCSVLELPRVGGHPQTERRAEARAARVNRDFTASGPDPLWVADAYDNAMAEAKHRGTGTAAAPTMSGWRDHSTVAETAGPYSAAEAPDALG